MYYGLSSLIIRLSEKVTKSVDLLTKLCASKSPTSRKPLCPRTVGLLFPVQCPSLPSPVISGSLLSVSYIKRDRISHEYLETYTKIMRSCFSFMVLLRLRPGSVSTATTLFGLSFSPTLLTVRAL